MKSISRSAFEGRLYPSREVVMLKWSSYLGLAAAASTGLLCACSSSGGDPSASSSAGGAGGSVGVSSSSSGGSTGSGGDDPQGTAPEGFGPNVLIFDPSMPMATIQAKIDEVFKAQESNQFGTARFAYFFKPGQYSLDVQVGFYMHVIGLGQSPDDVTITGAVRSKADWAKGNATQNFWRTAENLAVVPTLNNNIDVWAVSQATALRRFHVKGSMDLWDRAYEPAWSSGGFIADSKIDNTIVSGSQQQFLTRNSVLTNWQGGVWNMVFVGDEQPPSGAWPASPYSVVDKTPVVREKPYLTIDSAGNYSVMVPALKQSSVGVSWGAGAPATPSLPLDAFYLAHAEYDTAGSINAALAAGKNLILTPGVYHLKSSLQVSRPGTIVLGLGLATLIPDQGTSAMTIADVDGVSVSGVLFDAGATETQTMLQIGDAKSGADHAADPTALFDVSCRVGGANAGSAQSCVTINSNNAFLDNVWLWRADHGSGVGWTVNKSTNGLIVNGSDVTAYGLFVEHFQEYQTLWNGERGRVYFYQSEIPYDVPSQDAWTHGGVKGYSSYKVADSVKTHDALGLGVYCVFNNPVILENAFETPTAPGVSFHHLVTEWLGVAKGSAINHIINGQGATVSYVAQGITSAQSPD
jgi:hypothetical protein